jgi:gamma-glutamylcyclotransferase (GGCT)/AIG2-like uncharacterized protein YtfP
MFYFSYGSNMHPDRMARRCPGCAFVTTARLADHRLTFSRYWDAWGGGGVGDIQPAPGSVVEGVVWEITDAHCQTLDVYEDCPTSYVRKDVVVRAADGKTLTAFAYVARPTGVYRPARRYLQEILEGAQAHHLSPDYIAFLEAIPTED